MLEKCLLQPARRPANGHDLCASEHLQRQTTGWLRDVRLRTTAHGVLWEAAEKWGAIERT